MAGDAAWYSSASGGSSYRPIVGGVAAGQPAVQPDDVLHVGDGDEHYPNARIRPTVAACRAAPHPRRRSGHRRVRRRDRQRDRRRSAATTIENNFEPGDGHVAVIAGERRRPRLRLRAGDADRQRRVRQRTERLRRRGQRAAHGRLRPAARHSRTACFAGTRLDRLNVPVVQDVPEGRRERNATTLQLDADYDSTDRSTAFQGRAVFEPSLAGQAAVTNETWQTWNPLTAPSGWWQTGNAIVGGVNVGTGVHAGEPVLVRAAPRRVPGRGDPADHRAESAGSRSRAGSGSRPAAAGPAASPATSTR